MTPGSEPTLASCGPRKRRIAHLAARSPLTTLARQRDARRPVLRVFNFHSVPQRFEGAFERLVDHLAERFEPVGPFALEDLVETGPGDRSRSLLSFDDGLANHAEVASKVLERMGLRAIFCIPATFPSVERARQAGWFVEHIYPVPTELHPVEERRAMTWDQARVLAAAGHRICSHGHDHVILRSSTPPSVVAREVVESRTTLERELPGTTIDGFAWAGAEDPAANYSDRLIRETYDYSFGNNAHAIRSRISPYNIARINLEVSWPLEVVDFQISGAIDALFAVRRARGRARPLEPRP